MDQLPLELLLIILHGLKEIELEQVALVNKQFYRCVLLILRDRHYTKYGTRPDLTIRQLSDLVRPPNIRVAQGEEWRYKGWAHHRYGAPAIIRYYNSGIIQEKQWWYRNLLHREDGPAIVLYNELCQSTCKAWYRDGKMHRDQGPAVIYYRPDGTIISESWYQYGRHHRDSGPAYTEHRPNNTMIVMWYYEDTIHREDGPAWSEYRADGSLIVERWYRHGRLLYNGDHVNW